ncbi:MAG: hypothetical protein ACKVQV_04755 [Bacteroidia bacterium]
MWNKLVVMDLGFRIEEPKTPPILLVHRFRIYKVSNQEYIEKEKNIKHLNFRIFGDQDEFVEIRIYVDNMNRIEKAKSFHLRGFDCELVRYITLAVIIWVKNKVKSK